MRNTCKNPIQICRQSLSFFSKLVWTRPLVRGDPSISFAMTARVVMTTKSVTILTLTGVSHANRHRPRNFAPPTRRQSGRLWVASNEHYRSFDVLPIAWSFWENLEFPRLSTGVGNIKLPLAGDLGPSRSRCWQMSHSLDWSCSVGSFFFFFLKSYCTKMHFCS